MFRRLVTFTLVAVLTSFAVTFWLQVDEPEQDTSAAVDSRLSKSD